MAAIRSARLADADELAGIGIRAWESAIAGWINVELLRENAHRAFINFTRERYLTIDVTEKGGQATGWAARENFDNHISDLWVDPFWLKQVYGLILLDKLEQEFMAQGYETVTVETHAQNVRAIDFLKRQGYSINWMTAIWSPLLDRDVDTVGLVKRLVEEKSGGGYSEF